MRADTEHIPTAKHLTERVVEETGRALNRAIRVSEVRLGQSACRRGGGLRYRSRVGPWHLSDGVYLWRDQHGIHVAVADDATELARVLHHFAFDKSSWASAVAQTTIEGETGTTFRIAEALLG